MGPGDVIAGTYEVIRRLGAGGMGTVFEARHLRIPKRVAIKVLTAAPDPEMLARFRLEAEIASKLGHPHIVDVIDLDTLPSGVPYMVMELLDGENLRVRLRRGKPALAEALRIVRQIASALRAAHGASVIHRDLKPENVFLARAGLSGADHVKLLDFGISKVHGIALTANNVVLGTPAYMAPEQATGAAVDARADQFALAMLSYELLTGSLPFPEAESTRIMQIIAYEPLPPLGPRAPDVPAHVVGAIERALSKDPRERFASMDDFVAALDGRVVPPPPSAITAHERPAQRPRWLLVGLALMIASVGVTSIVLVLRKSEVTIARDAAMPVDAAAIDAVPDAMPDALPDAAPISDAPAIDAARIDAAITRKEATETVLPPAVLAELDQAQAALMAGDDQAAARIARRTLETSPSKRAYLILVEAACRSNDLAAARGWMRSMPAAVQPRAKSICAALGLEL